MPLCVLLLDTGGVRFEVFPLDDVVRELLGRACAELVRCVLPLLLPGFALFHTLTRTLQIMISIAVVLITMTVTRLTSASCLYMPRCSSP